MSERLDFFTPCVGRFVSGSLTEKRAKDYEGRPIPEDKQHFEFGVAFQKAEIWPLLTEQWYPYLTADLASTPDALSRMQNWFSTFTGFSMKVSDGDKPNAKGVLNENTQGCFVMWFSTGFLPKAVGADPAFTEIDIATIKRGYFVQVAGNIVFNGQQGDRVGIYINVNVVRLIAEGDEIRGGVDAATAFGGASAPTALPPGARPLGTASGAGQAFGAVPPTVPVPMPGATVPMPGMASTQPPAPQTIASHGSLPPAPPNVAPHTAILTGPPPLPGQR